MSGRVGSPASNVICWFILIGPGSKFRDHRHRGRCVSLASVSSFRFMASLLNRTRWITFRPSGLKLCRVRFSSTHPSPLMLTNLPPVIYPNLFLFMRNLVTRLTITNTLDRSFAIKPFCEGARQALTVVSHLIGQEQFDDLPGFVSKEVKRRQ